MDIYEKSLKSASFNQWLTELPTEDLQYISEALDAVDNGKESDDITDVMSQLIPLIIHFSGNTEVSENKLDKYFQHLVMDTSMEVNIREGRMTKEGSYSLLKDEETARFSITPKGSAYVESLFNKSSEEDK